jgi:hypothetical protein
MAWRAFSAFLDFIKHMAPPSTMALKINGLWSSVLPTLVEHVLENVIVYGA